MFLLELKNQTSNIANRTAELFVQTVPISSCDSAWVSVTSAIPRGNFAKTHLRQGNCFRYAGFWETFCSIDVHRFHLLDRLRLYERNFTLKVRCSPLSEIGRKTLTIIQPVYPCTKSKNRLTVRVPVFDARPTSSFIINVCVECEYSIPPEPQRWTGCLLCCRLSFWCNFAAGNEFTTFSHHISTAKFSKGRAKIFVCEALLHNFRTRLANRSEFFCVLLGPK